ncbi:uncharacterized protein LOC119370941 [Jatropha curcas]|uniref:uncharacterized protein LOC119370941 n=1 Tax=Jatropha curcas TaxID=180498 RepID=UPI001894CB62|nr:uncharacterized protein LOC119370941 [Jatropha curcas]
MALSTNSNITHSSGMVIIAIKATQFPLKPTSQSYPTWHAQVSPLLRGHNLLSYVDGTNKPAATIITKDGQELSNPNFEFRYCQDQLILEKLQVSFANKSTTRVLSLGEKLSNTKRDTKSVTEYLHSLKNVANELALCGNPVSDVELVVYVLNGISTKFRDIAAAVHSRDTVITFEELQSFSPKQNYHQDNFGFSSSNIVAADVSHSQGPHNPGYATGNSANSHFRCGNNNSKSTMSNL